MIDNRKKTDLRNEAGYRRLFVLPLLAMSCAALISLTSCIDDVPEYRPRLVVEGWIEQGQNPIVMLTVPISPETGQVEAIESLVRWGRVTISDGDTTCVLSGMSNRNYFPPYIYTTYDMEGEVGKTYTIRATWKGMETEGESALSAPFPIDSVTAEPVDGQSDRRNLTLWITGREGEHDYFRVFTLLRGVDRRYLPGMFGTLATEGRGGALGINVSRPKTSVDTVEYMASYLVGDTVQIKLCRTSRYGFDFWTDYQNAVTLGGSSIISNSYRIRSNLSAGLGYWLAYGSATLIYIVR